jgi:hypothetical protein
MTLEAASLRLPPVVRAVAPFLDPRAWGALAYVWLGFPLGLAWFIVLTVGFAAGVPLTLVWVGFLLLFLTVVAAWGAEGLERRLAMFLLGARVPERRARPAGPESFRRWFVSVVGGPAFWKGLAFLVLRFPLGLAGWVVSVVSLAVSLALLGTPLAVSLDAGEVHIPFWLVETPFDALPLALAGLLGLIGTFHLHRAMGWAWARLAEALLGAGGAVPATPAAPPAASAEAS